MTDQHKVTDICPNCRGEGFVIETKMEHGCNGTDEDCLRICPVQALIQICCGACGGSGQIEFVAIGKIIIEKNEKRHNCNRK
jgi:hypothetical protein